MSDCSERSLKWYNVTYENHAYVNHVYDSYIYVVVVANLVELFFFSGLDALVCCVVSKLALWEQQTLNLTDHMYR